MSASDVAVPGASAAGEEAAAPPLAPAQLAWLAALPCALVVFAAMLLLGSAVGSLTSRAAPHDFWPALVAAHAVRPEPTEQGRYVVSLLAPLLLLGVVVLGTRRRLRLRAGLAAALVRASQLLLAVVAVTMVVVVQRLHLRLGSIFYPRAYFDWTTIALAAAFTALAAVAAQRARWRAAIAGLARETRVRRVLAVAVAAVVVGVWMLVGINTDSSIGASAQVFVEMQNMFDAAFAALHGEGPYVHIHALYGQLMPYLPAGAMKLFGGTLTVYTIAMVSLTAGTMAAMFATLRRVARSSLGGLALFLPFMATSFFMIRGTLVDRLDPVNLFSVFPERYAGPYLLAWLTARHLDRARPRSVVGLFVAAGVVLFNDFEFGIAALGGTLAAVLWTQPAFDAAALARLLRGVALGVLAAALLVVLAMLAVTGALPHFSWLLTYSRIFGSGGFSMFPLAAIGIHVTIYLTFAGALTLASVRAVRREPDRLLTGMLAWSGVFGFGTLAYYVGQSHPQNLIFVFSSWALGLVLLALVAVRAILARAPGRPALVELLVLFGFGLAACSLAQLPAPWSQLERLERGTARPAYTDNSLERFVAADTHPGEPVLMLNRLPHRIAYDTGVHDVVAYCCGIESIPLASLLRESITRLQRAHGHVVFVWTTTMWPEETRMLNDAGFVVTRRLVDDSIAQFEGQYLELRDDRKAAR